MILVSFASGVNDNIRSVAVGTAFDSPRMFFREKDSSMYSNSGDGAVLPEKSSLIRDIALGNR